MPKSKRNGRKSNKLNKMKKMKGGSAWQFAQSVYGAPNAQTSVGVYPNGGTSNLIAMNQSGGGLTPLMPDSYSDQAPSNNAVVSRNTGFMMGGEGEEKLPQTPAVLMGGEGEGEEKMMQTPGVMMGGSGFVPLQPAVYNDSTLSEQGNTLLNASSASAATNVLTNYNTTMGGGSTQPVKSDGSMDAPFKLGVMGGKLRGRKGGNVISEIAVPATLLIANEFVKNRKVYTNKKNRSGKNGKGKMYSRRRRFNRR